jgi:hypothetical protein
MLRAPTAKKRKQQVKITFGEIFLRTARARNVFHFWDRVPARASSRSRPPGTRVFVQ